MFKIGDVVYNAKNGKGVVVSAGQSVIVRHNSGQGAKYGNDGMGIDGRLHFFAKQDRIPKSTDKGHDATD